LNYPYPAPAAPPSSSGPYSSSSYISAADGIYPLIKNSNAISGLLLAAANAWRQSSLGLPEIAINSFTAASTSGGNYC